MDVFISHSSQDKAIADAACAALESAGLSCWIAPRNITPGADWGAAIVEGIEQSRLFVLVFTGHANRSPQVLREVERAVAKGLPIIPFRVENLQPTKGLEFFISSQHWLDAFPPPMEQHLAKLTKTAKLLLEGPESDASSSARSPTLNAATTPARRRSAWKLAMIGVATVALLITTAIFYISVQSHASVGGSNEAAPEITRPADNTNATPPAPDPPKHDPVYERILRERFALADTYGDESLSLGELRRLLARLRGTPADQFQRVFTALDVNADDRIGENELLAFAKGLVLLRDQDGDGQMTSSEFLTGAHDPGKSASRKTVEMVFRNRDRNRDGFVTVRETEEALAIDWVTPN